MSNSNNKCYDCKFFVPTVLPNGICELSKGYIGENVHVYNWCSNFINKPLTIQQKEAFSTLVREVYDA